MDEWLTTTLSDPRRRKRISGVVSSEHDGVSKGDGVSISARIMEQMVFLDRVEAVMMGNDSMGRWSRCCLLLRLFVALLCKWRVLPFEVFTIYFHAAVPFQAQQCSTSSCSITLPLFSCNVHGVIALLLLHRDPFCIIRGASF